MKYFIDGGGYFPDIKDYAKRQEERKTYLEHCRRVVKDNNVRSRDYLIAQLKTDVEKAIATEYSSMDPDFKGTLESYTSAIFKSWEESDEYTSWFSKNCLQAVNTVSLQIVVLFTLASYDFKNPEFKPQNDVADDKSTQTLYLNFVEDDIWTNYEYAKTRDIVKLLVKTKGIITVLRHLSIDNILGQYFDGWYTSQVVYNEKLTDALLWSPFDYILHDENHFEIFNALSISKLKKIKQFYHYIRKIRDKDKRYSVMLIYFVFLHEGRCDCFNKALMEGDLSDENHRFYSSNKLSQMIFFNKEHSLQFIPEKYRGLIEHEQDGVLSYLNTAMTNYLYTLEEFEKNVQHTVKPIDEARTKRYENIDSWKNKPIPELLIDDGELTEDCVGEVCGFRLWGGTRRKKKKKHKKSRKYPKSLG